MKMGKITVEVVVAVSPRKAWEFYVEPKHITKWNFASDDWQCPSAESDLKVGGKYKARMEAKDGSFGFDFEATYDEVKEQKTLTYTMGDGRKATTQFEDLGGKTKVMTTFDAEAANPEKMQRDGWQAILNNFKKYAETH
jgi:uncharacterized protein YndB with AHSA1/START domain